MVLVSFVLVVVAAITLVIGLLQSGLAIIYVSIACSVLAGIVLATAVLRGRPEPRGAGVPQRAPTPATQPDAAPATWVAPGQTPSPSPSPQPAPVSAGGGVAVAERDDSTQAFERLVDDEADEMHADDDFPIRGYDTLRATEILPMLAELSGDQLEAVEERERSGKSRAMVLKRIEVQKQARAAEVSDQPEGWDAGDDGWDVGAPPPPPDRVETRPADGDDDADDDDDEDWDDALASEPEPEPEPEPVPVPVPVAARGPMSVRPAPAVGEFPIPDYDDLKALEVLGRLPDLSVTELHLVRRREEDGLRRAMVLNRVDRLIEEAPPEPEPIVVVPPRRRSTTRSAPKKASPTKRAATRVSGAKKVFTPPAAVAVPAKRIRTAKAATAAPAKRATTAKKAPASTRKAVAETRATTAKKVAATRKAGAKKATKRR